MIEQVYSKPDIFKIHVPLPNNPLRNLNSYFIKGSDRNLLIDTGFNQPECYEALVEGLKELDADMNHTDIFITHLHADHSGLVKKIMTPDSTVYFSEKDYNYLVAYLMSDSWQEIDEKFNQEGVPWNVLENLRKTNPSIALTPEGPFPVSTIVDGNKLKGDEYEFTCIATPGHTPEHMCLYLESEQLIFLGDHVLFDITPNITLWHGHSDSLGAYIDSLRKVKRLKVKTCMPAHRNTSNAFYERIDRIIEHHRERLEEVLHILAKDNRRLSAYEVTKEMTWRIRGNGWEDFPDNQKWFATGEAMAHLDYLVCREYVIRSEIEGKFYYELNPLADEAIAL